MGLVNTLKFSSNSGAIITDEEFFIGGRRRVHTSDNLQSLLSEEMSNELGMEAVFGGIGNLSVVSEVISGIKALLNEQYSQYRKSGDEKKIFRSIEDVARVSLKIFQKISHDRVNKKLYGLLGFSIDDFNRGYYESEGEKIEIKDDRIISKALDIILMKDSGMKNISELEAIVIGTDREFGFNAFDFYGGMTHLYISTSLYNAVGAGATSTSLAFSNLINSLTLDHRRNGMDRVAGMVELIRITNQTALKNSEVGGYYDIVFIDGTGRNRKERYTEVTGDRSQLLKEIVGAYDNGFISKDICYQLTEKIIFSSDEFNFREAENFFFSNATDTEKLNLYLRGYKINN
ncbi:MAG: hypothetical protein JSS91_10670 [Bacteroidetes bacterium]|nr:hypothetical protein [Bacteroidota bacterium]